MNKKVFAKERREKLIALLKQQQSMSTQALAEKMFVSTITVRRDLDQLESEGLIERVHGGAVLALPKIQTSYTGLEPIYQVKMGLQQREKIAIAMRATQEVRDKSTVILDSGTTCLALAQALAGRDVTIIALDSQVGQAAAVGKTQVHLPGGLLRNDLFSLVGPWVHDILRHLYADIFFMSADALTVDGITNSMVEEAQIKRLAMQQSQRTILLADHTKINRHSLTAVTPITSIDLWITDIGASPLIMPYQSRVKALEMVHVPEP